MMTGAKELRTPYTDIQAQQRKILPMKHPKPLQIQNDEPKNNRRCHLIASPPLSLGDSETCLQSEADVP